MLSCWLCQGNQGPHPGDQPVRDLESHLCDKEDALLSYLRRSSECDSESHLRDKEDALLSCLCHSSERDQELHRHHVLIRTAEESAKVKACEFEEYQTAKYLEI
jgi:tRNA-dihydrouridine synthase